MAQPLTEALAKRARAAAQADELERDRIAWNLPRGEVVEESGQPDRSEPSAPKPADSGEPGR
jgi:hypothetical protein